MCKVGIVIVAAGTSSRMGTSKQLLEFKGKTILQQVIETAKQSRAKKVVCVLGSNSHEISESISNQNVEIVFNENFNSGLSSSIVRGLKSSHVSHQDAVIILLGDQPFISSKYLNKMIDQFYKKQHIIASKYQVRYGVPALFPRKHFKDLLKLEGELGAKKYLNRDSTLVSAVDYPVDLSDIDTPSDYDQMLRGSNL